MGTKLLSLIALSASVSQLQAQLVPSRSLGSRMIDFWDSEYIDADCTCEVCFNCPQTFRNTS